MAAREFRFGVSGQRHTRGEWQELARKAEDQGFSTLLLPDHLGPQLAPLLALQAAAEAAQRLRVGTIVIDNDFRHPAMLAKEAATLDVLTDGRFELGIGAGWMLADYTRTGIPFDPPGVRIARLTEAIHIIKRFFEGGPVTFKGQYYRVEELDGFPPPVQQPRIPILIAGSRPRMLRLAAREADIVGLEDHQFAARAQGDPEIQPARLADQVTIVREAAGDRVASIELNLMIARLEVTDDRQAAIDRYAEQLQLPPQVIAESASFLIGSREYMIERLQQQREELGVSYVLIFAGMMDDFAPIVAHLAGT
jgi:probable F420-dependent oxidoreductase